MVCRHLHLQSRHIVARSLCIMACANGSAEVNGVRSRLSGAHRRSRTNRRSRNGAGAGAAADETAGNWHLSNGQLSNGHLGNGHLPNPTLTGGGQQQQQQATAAAAAAAAASGRVRRASSSSNGSNDSVNAAARMRRTADSSTSKKGKPGRTKNSEAAASPSSTTAAVDNGNNTAAQASCADCNLDLTDSEVEVCQTCFGLRKRRNNVDDERCPYPFGFLKKKYLPLWMHEPEYIMSPRPKRKKSNPESDQAQENHVEDVDQ